MDRVSAYIKRCVAALLVIAMGVGSFPIASEAAGIFDFTRSSATYTEGTEWERYGSYYFYNQMSRVEREFYDALNTRCMEFITGDEDAIKYDYKGVTYHLVGYVGSDDLTIPQMVQIARIFKYNNPQYYFLSTMIFPKSADNTISYTTYSRFADGEERKESTDTIRYAIKKCRDSVAFARSVGEKVRAIHDYVISLTDYEEGLVKEDTSYTQSVYSVLTGGVGRKSVCSGYSQTFMMLCNAFGIDCICVTSALHQWNKVRIDDVWYNVDTTWDDLGLDEDGVSQKKYTYFCRSDSEVVDLDSSDYHTIEDFWTDFLLPTCSVDSGATKSDPGTLFSPSDSVVSPGYTITESDTAGYFEVSLYSATSESEVYYTTDGREPDMSYSKSRLYTKPIRVKKGTLIRAVASRDRFNDSSVLKVLVNEATTGGTSVRLSDCRVTLAKTKFKYTGDPIIPTIKSVTYQDRELKEGEDYVITGCSNNTDVGTAKMVIAAVSGTNYKGTKTISYSISAYLLPAPVLSVKNVNRGIKLTWQAVDGAKGYILERRLDGKKKYVRLTKQSARSYVDKTVVPGQKYYYRVTGYSAGNKYRKTYCKAILTCRLSTGTVESVVSEKSGTMRVSWKADTAASGYQVKYISGKEGRMFDVTSRYTTATVTGLDAGRTYRVYVRSFCTIGDYRAYSKWSPSKKVKVMSQTVKGAHMGSISRTPGISFIYAPEAFKTDTAASHLKGAKAYSSDYDIYSSYYYYNRLSTREKKYYNALNLQCVAFLTTQTDLTDRISYQGRSYYYLPAINFHEMGLTAAQAEKVVMIFKFNNPQYFFLTGSDLSDDLDDPHAFAACVYTAFAKYSARKTAMDTILATADSWDDQIMAADTDAEKVRVIHDLIIDRVSYNTPLFNSGFANEDTEYSQSIYSVLAWPSKKTVCAGYSLAFMFLCNRYGIDAACLTSSEHQWNVVRVDDQWYEVDLTWDDDPYGNGSLPVVYTFFCRSSRKMDAIDASVGSEYHEEESYYKNIRPECVYDTASTLDGPGEFFEPYGAVKAPTITFDGKKATVKASTKKAVLYYTTDGSVPSPGSTRAKIYKKPIALYELDVLKVVAVRPGYFDSAVSTVSYTLETPRVKSVKAAGTDITVSWKKESGLSGHEISLTYGGRTKIIRVSGKKKVSKVISSLTPGTYKLKVRSYIRSGKKMYYSPWSGTKKVTLS